MGEAKRKQFCCTYEHTQNKKKIVENSYQELRQRFTYLTLTLRTSIQTVRSINDILFHPEYKHRESNFLAVELKLSQRDTLPHLWRTDELTSSELWVKTSEKNSQLNGKYIWQRTQKLAATSTRRKWMPKMFLSFRHIYKIDLLWC